MEKLTSILAVAPSEMDVPLLLHKTVTLAKAFGARIEMLVWDRDVAHVVERLCREHGYKQVSVHNAHRGTAPLHERILGRVRAARPDLVVKSPAGARTLRRFTLEENDWQLVEACPVPVLLMRAHPWSDPVRFASAVDVSDEHDGGLARALLHSAGFLALGMHGGLDILYSEREMEDEALRMQRAVRLAQLVREYHVGSEHLEMFSGDPEKRLPPLMAARRYDVLVLGGLSRREGLATLMPGTVSRMMEATDSDVLLVRAPEPELSDDLSARATNEPSREVRAF